MRAGCVRLRPLRLRTLACRLRTVAYTCVQVAYDCVRLRAGCVRLRTLAFTEVAYGYLRLRPLRLRSLACRGCVRLRTVAYACVQVAYDCVRLRAGCVRLRTLAYACVQRLRTITYACVRLRACYTKRRGDEIEYTKLSDSERSPHLLLYPEEQPRRTQR